MREICQNSSGLTKWSNDSFVISISENDIMLSMKRTVISLNEEDKDWLDRRAEEEGVPMTELVRRAVSLLRRRVSNNDLPIENLLEETRGLWTEGDGLQYQEQIREEW